MSTRAHIAFYEDEPKTQKAIKNDWEALIYRHSDGYPESEHGVVAELKPFLLDFQANRGIQDLEYCAARALQYLTNRYDGDLSPDGKKYGYNYLGYGISKQLHSDIEWLYAVTPNELIVYEVNGTWENPAYEISGRISLKVKETA